MNKGYLFLYASLGIVLGGGMSTNAVFGTSNTNDKNQKALLNVYKQKDNSATVYCEVSQFMPKKDYRLRYAKIAATRSFKECYSNKSLGDFIKVEY